MQLIAKRDKVVLNFRETEREQKGELSGQYPHIVDDKIYWQLAHPSEIAYARRIDNKYTKPLDNIIISKSLASENFRVFKDTRPGVPKDEKYKAIGGYHTGRGALKIKNPTIDLIKKSALHQRLRDCPISAAAEVVPTQDIVWPEEMRLLFRDDYSHPRHANGFYIFKSSNGVQWSLYHSLPILSGFTECEDGATLACDTMPSIFYDHNIDEYVVYLRCNIRLGVRHVLYSKSKDLINWDTPKLINKNPQFNFQHENLYYMGAYPYPNSEKYIAFPPHFKNDILTKDGSQRRYYDAKTLIMVSDDRVNWKVLDEIFFDQSSGHMTQKHVVSFTQEGGMYVLYVHEGFITYQNNLVRYTINKEELDTLIKGA